MATRQYRSCNRAINSGSIRSRAHLANGHAITTDVSFFGSDLITLVNCWQLIHFLVNSLMSMSMVGQP